MINLYSRSVLLNLPPHRYLGSQIAEIVQVIVGGIWHLSSLHRNALLKTDSAAAAVVVQMPFRQLSDILPFFIGR